MLKIAVFATVIATASIGCKKDADNQPTEQAPAPSAAKATANAAAKTTTDTPAAKVEPEPTAVSTARDFDAQALFDVALNTLDGKPTTVGAHKGKALLLVNVASKCGLTPQYETLERMQKKYSERGFTVLGFPCNQFGGQEPGSAKEIAEFCSATYGVTFPMFEKIEVNGEGRHPIYKVLTSVEDGKGEAGDIKWNFEKFVVSADGKSVHRFRPRTKPDAPEVVAAIESGLPTAN